MDASIVAPCPDSGKSLYVWLPPRVQILLEGGTLSPVELAEIFSADHEQALSHPKGRKRPSQEKSAMERLSKASPQVRVLLDYVHESKNVAPEWEIPLQEFAPMFPCRARWLRAWLDWEFDRITSNVEQVARTMLVIPNTEFKDKGHQWLDDCAKARFRWREPIIGNPYSSFVPLAFQYRAKILLRTPCLRAWRNLKETYTGVTTGLTQRLDWMRAGAVLDSWLDSTPFRHLHG